MSDDDTTIIEGVRRAASGKAPRSRQHYDRRAGDSLNLKDWIGYVLAILSPIAGALLLMWQSQAVQDQRIDRLESDIERAEPKREALWQRFGSHIEGHP